MTPRELLLSWDPGPSWSLGRKPRKATVNSFDVCTLPSHRTPERIIIKLFGMPGLAKVEGIEVC